MKLGIISDSHGRRARVAAAVQRLREAGADALIHCGDVGGEDVLAELTIQPAWFVWGNTDDPSPAAESFARTLGVTPPSGCPTTVSLHRRLIQVYHGHEPQFETLVRAIQDDDQARAAALLGRASYVLFGHTHQRTDVRAGQVRLINPGALHRASEYSAALLDLETDDLSYLAVP